MKISRVNNTNFSGVKLANHNYEHAKYVNKVLTSNGVAVNGYKTFLTSNDFKSKRNIADYVREMNNFCDNECGIIFFPQSEESWVIGNKFFEQRIKKILDCYFIDSEINLGI